MVAHQSKRSASTVRADDASSDRSSLRSEKRGNSSTAADEEEEKIGGGLLGDSLGLGREGREIKEDVIFRLPTANSFRPGLSKTQTNAKSLRSIRSHHSRAGADGYTLNDEDEKPNNSSSATEEAADPYLVCWEGGDADPMNPRSMTTLRRWCIVLIVSASSLCV